MEKLKLTVMILTKNNETIIDACLLTVYGWVDEIIILDDMSIDNTVEILKKYTNKIFNRKMENEGRHRNWGYAQAKNEWVLSLDSDERVTPELREEIGRILAGNPKESGFTIPRRNHIGDYWVKFGGWYPSPQLRLFRKDKFKYEEVQVHPRAFLDGVCGHLRSDMLHFSYKNLEDFWSKLNKQTTWEAQKWHDAGKKMTLGRFMWRTYDRFMRAYFGRHGYKEGLIGFVVAFNAGLYQILSYLKYQELAMKAKNEKNH